MDGTSHDPDPSSRRRRPLSDGSQACLSPPSFLEASGTSAPEADAMTNGSLAISTTCPIILRSCVPAWPTGHRRRASGEGAPTASPASPAPPLQVGPGQRGAGSNGSSATARTHLPGRGPFGHRKTVARVSARRSVRPFLLSRRTSVRLDTLGTSPSHGRGWSRRRGAPGSLGPDVAHRPQPPEVTDREPMPLRGSLMP